MGKRFWRRVILAAVPILLCTAVYGLQESEFHRKTLGNSDMQEAAAQGLADQTDRDTKRIALTFDDGPHSVYTEQLLDGLAKRNVKATFFLLGENIEGREDIVKRIQEEGHLIGSHTYYHVDISRLEQEEACQEIRQAVKAITDITGEEVEYIRPPFGNWNRELESSVCMIPVFWSLDTRDWMTRNADQIVQKVVTDVEENDIILMHDSYESTVKAALRIIDLLQAKGYEFVTADQLILE